MRRLGRSRSQSRDERARAVERATEAVANCATAVAQAKQSTADRHRYLVDHAAEAADLRNVEQAIDRRLDETIAEAEIARSHCLHRAIGAPPIESSSLEAVSPATVEQVRYDLAVELLDDIRRLDTQLRALDKWIRDAVRASATSVTRLFGVGPTIAGMLIGYTGDVTRFRDRDHYAAYHGTAPVESSSGGRVVHRLSERGNRQLNPAIHMAAICQLRQPHGDGRAYFERKVADGKTNKEAIRSLNTLGS